ncbi:MAG TPA: transglutaminase family protein [Burkholderiaceae bacterium]|nr:transglutaminase family protein [Burkholderiaceae bacterium]
MPDGPPRGVPAAAAGPEFVERCRAAGGLLDADHPSVRRFVAAAIGSAEAPRERAVRVFYAVRDRIRYDPFTCSPRREDYLASAVADSARNWCVPKAGLLAAACRAAGIPAAVGLADVTNHLNTEKLRRALGGTDVFHDHGYAALWLDGRWVKAAAVFNLELCERFGVRPTEFDGEHDALLQEHDAASRRHMEYLRDDGLYADLPFETVMADFAAHYPPAMLDGGVRRDGPRFEDDRPV